MSTTERRITAATNTIPAYTALNGTVTTSASDTTVLLYSGTSNWDTIFHLPAAPATLSPNPFSTSANSRSHQDRVSDIWIYVPSATVKLARVIGFTYLTTNSWALQLDRDISGAAGAACNYVVANLLSYFWLNDGVADGSVNGVTVQVGEYDNAPQLAPAGSRVTFQDPLVIVATSTDFLIRENT